MSGPSIDVTGRPGGTGDTAGPSGAPEAVARGTDRATVDAEPATSARPPGSLQWPAVVALTAALAFAGLVAAGLFDPMIEAL